MYFFPIIVVFLVGTVIGSFINVVIYRVPKGESVVFPRSKCQACQHTLGFFDLFPLFSYVFLMGKCRYCGIKISPRYFFVELLSGMVFVCAFYYFGIGLEFARVCILSSLLLAITFIDYDHMIIPDGLSIGGTAIALVLGIFAGSVMDSIVGGLVGAGIIYAIYILGLLIYRKETMGGGDVKLMLMVGMFVGLQKVLLAIFIALTAGSVIGIVLIALKIKSRKDYIPFGPFLALGSMVAVFFPQVLDWYLKLFH